MTTETTDLAGNPEMDPEDWTTGDQKMTGRQASSLQTLEQEAVVIDAGAGTGPSSPSVR